jgi:hypothetical protein
VLGLIVVLVVIGTTIWVGIDASQRVWPKGQNGTASWVVGCLLLWIVVFPWYLSKRNKVPLKSAPVASIVAPGAAHSSLPVQAQAYRECPHCKESMRRDASVCPHCRTESAAWRWHEGRWCFRGDEQKPWQWLDEQSGTWVTATSS